MTVAHCTWSVACGIGKAAHSPPVLSKTFITNESKRRRLEGKKVSAREADLMHRAYIAGIHAAKFRRKSRQRGGGGGAASNGSSRSSGGGGGVRGPLGTPGGVLPPPSFLASPLAHPHHVGLAGALMSPPPAVARGAGGEGPAATGGAASAGGAAGAAGSQLFDDAFESLLGNLGNEF